jgi:regulator of sigma E protease
MKWLLPIGFVAALVFLYSAGLMSWFLAFAGFAVLIVLHEAGHFTAAKAVGMKVEKFYLFFPPKLVAFRRGETEYGIGAIPLGGFVKITGMNPDEEVPPEDAHRTYYSSPVWKRIVVIGAGPLVNVVIAFVIFWALFSTGEEGTNEVTAVIDGGAAAGVLEPGDEILAVDGVTGDFDELREQIATHTCPGDATDDGCEAATPAELTIGRDGRELTRSVTPTYSEEAGRMLVGFEPGTQPVSASEGVSLSADAMWAITSGTAKVFANIFDAEQRKQISGVVGSYEVTRQAIEFDARRALFILGVISLSLAIINLFPFLPLDGGHIFWSLVEKVRGRPVSFSVMERASVLGIVLVAMLFVIGLSNDIGRLSGEGFDIR